MITRNISQSDYSELYTLVNITTTVSSESRSTSGSDHNFSTWVERTTWESKTGPCSDYRLCDLDVWFNSSNEFRNGSINTTMEPYTHEDYSWAVLFLAPFIVFGIAGNILVCMAISMEKRLQSVTNYFLLSLAVTDLLVCVIVMPFSIINEFTGYWPFGPIVCDLYVTSDVLMCTSSILHLCTISLERYMAIRFPLATRNKSKNIVKLKIVLVWVTAVAITSPITILGFIDEKNVLNDNQCSLTNSDFIIYGSICAFFIPLTIMIISYSFTLYLLIGQSKKLQNGKQEGQPMIRRSLSRKANKKGPRVKFSTRRTQSCPLDNQQNDQNYTPIITRKSRLKSSVSFPIHPVMVNSHSQCSSGEQSPMCSARVADRQASRFANVNIPETVGEENHKINSRCSTPEKIWTRNSGTSSLQGLVKKHQLVIKAASILLMKKDDATMQKQEEVHTEQKASKVIGIVFILFVICWAPFFIVNILTVLCHSCYFEPTLITAFVWLGWISSTLNPIIYTMFNKTFKMTFKKLILCRYHTLQRRKRVQSWLLSNGSAYQQNASSSNSLDTPC